MQLRNSTEIDRIDCYIHFAVKSGKVIWGVDNLERSRRIPFLILVDGALGENSSKQLELYCQRRNVKSLKLPTNYLNNLLKRSNIKVLSILDESLANAILKYCDDNKDTAN